MQPEGSPDAARSRSWTRTVFGVVARSQTWLNVVYLWLAFPLGLFYFVFLVTGISVGVSLVIVLVGIPILLLVAAAWWCLAALERALARSLLGADVPPAPRLWERGDDVWGRIKAHFGAGVIWSDLLYLFLKFPMGLVSFVLCVTGLAIVVGFIGAPLMQMSGQLYVAGQRVDSWALALALVPVGLLAAFAWAHLVNGWAWVSRCLAEGLLRAAPPVEAAEPEVEPAVVPAAAAWQGAAASWSQAQMPPWPPAAQDGPAQGVAPGPAPVWVQTEVGWQLMPPQGWPAQPAAPAPAQPPAPARPPAPAQPPAPTQPPAPGGDATIDS
jgi:hypothetical protein